MIAYVLYVKDAPDQSSLTAFTDRLATFQVEAKLVDADSTEGIALAQNYDLLARPAVALVRDDGTLVDRWQGGLPAVEDISYLAHQ